MNRDFSIGELCLWAVVVLCTVVGVNTLVDKAMRWALKKASPVGHLVESPQKYEARMQLMDIQHAQLMALVNYRNARSAYGTFVRMCLPQMQDTYTDYDRYKTAEEVCVAQLEAQAHSKKDRVLRGIEEP